MSTSSTSFQLNLPADYPYNQDFSAQLANISTDTETQPTVSTYDRSRQVARAEYSAENRNIQVQTKVFRTDQDNGSVDFQSCYTTVNKSKI